MDLNEIAIFVKVVQTGSFTHTARQLGMPNSTVSHKVKSLEKRLGVTLIQRTTRKLNVTPAGQAYFKRCIQGLESIQAAEGELAAIQGEPSGLFRVTAPVELGSSILADLISTYTAKYPRVRVEAILTDRTVDLLSESVDLAIRAGDLEDSSLIAKKIGSVYFAPFASPKYLKAKGTPVHPRDLRNHECVHFTPLGIEAWQLTGPKGSLEIPVPSRITVNDLDVVKTLATHGKGIALMPTYYCLPEVRAGKLERLLPDWHSDLAPVHFVYPAQRFVTPNLSAFIALATDSMKEMFAKFEI
jgi:DNA-binding transcriptional LysR family regulator